MPSYLHGKEVYQARCVNCHKADGQGFGKLYPPLAGSDYLVEDRMRSAQIVKNGLQGEIEVNGKKYNMPMPHNETLIDQDIADVLTYIYNTWGNKEGTYSVEMVKKALNH